MKKQSFGWTAWQAARHFKGALIAVAVLGLLIGGVRQIESAPATLPVSIIKILQKTIAPDLAITVDTIAALRDLDRGGLIKTVKVRGYYAAGDGGGGPVRLWVSGAAAGTYVDSGGNVIVPTGGDGSAAWIWEQPESVHVKWFGAVCDGVVDDTSAIQNTIIAVYKKGGGNVLIGNAQKITSTILLYPHVKLIGSGHSTSRISTTLAITMIRLHRPDSGYVPAYNMQSAVIGMSLDGNSTDNDTGSVGIDISEAMHSLIEDVEFGNHFVGVAFNKWATEQAKPFNGSAYWHEIKRCIFASCRRGIRFGGAANRNTFYTNNFMNCWTAYDFSTAGNVAETNVSINDNIEGCNHAFQWSAVEANIFGQTWIGLTIENDNAYVCTVQDPGRQLFINLGLIPSEDALKVDFYKIHSKVSTLIGSLNSSAGVGRGTRLAEDVQLYGGITYYSCRGTSASAFNPSLANNATGYQDITVPGCLVGDTVSCTPNKDLLTFGFIHSATILTNGTVRVSVKNVSGVTKSPDVWFYVTTNHRG